MTEKEGETEDDPDEKSDETKSDGEDDATPDGDAKDDAESPADTVPAVATQAEPPAPPAVNKSLVERMEEVCHELDALKQRVEGWKELPNAKSVNFTTITGDIGRLRTDLWAQRPAFQCPYCDGSGKDRKGSGEACTGCRGCGKVPKYVFTAGNKAMAGGKK